MRLALVLHHHPFLGIPGVASHAIFIVDGHPGVIANVRAGTALGPILVHFLEPLPRQFDLGKGRWG
jgi:hypothetical protein